MRRPVPIQVRCPSCEVVHVTVANLTIRVCVDTGRWTYCFRCPSCGCAAAHESESYLLAEVAALGAETVEWHLPAELAEPRPTGEVFTWDDLLDFHLLLEDDEQVATRMQRADGLRRSSR